MRRLPSRSVEPRPLGPDDRLVLVAHSRPGVPRRRGSQLDNASVVLASYDDAGLRDVVAVLDGQSQGSLAFSGSVRPAATGTLEAGAFDAFAGRIHLCVSHDGGSLPEALRSRFPLLRALPWARTREAVDWRRLGVDGDGLASILARFGLFADVETPREGCEALVVALSAGRWLMTEDPPFAQIRHRIDERRVEVVATGPTYAIRDDLKVRGYRWNHGVGGAGKCWTLVCPYRSALVEVAWLRHRLHAQGGSAEMRELS
ncbi:hypothetical protein [Aureimonas jatrophae]|nr:hypothetical protein [Aureimonas jatrophae]MBB3951518.1 DNA polymerase-3 subunit epsilon [Aureimonas jatrophae]